MYITCISSAGSIVEYGRAQSYKAYLHEELVKSLISFRNGANPDRRARRANSNACLSPYEWKICVVYVRRFSPTTGRSNTTEAQIDFAEIVGRQFDDHCANVLVQAMQLRSAWDWNGLRLLSEQPSQRYLSRCRLLPFCDSAKQ